MKTHERLNYVEFAARDLSATKSFFTAAFGWQFADYGPDYCAFEGEGLDGGFYRADLCGQSERDRTSAHEPRSLTLISQTNRNLFQLSKKP